MDQLSRVIVGALVTEKSERLRAEHGQYTFRVATGATKIEVRRAVEKLFKVHVTDVRVMNYQGKKRRMGMFSGRRPDWRKAVVTVKAGERIEALER
ncbi:MAG TPA: 50S ribosomal protein L23 [candidate division WOR-3 bacterium]|uniref:Large ribosomal subunit protein uL23 n=1 Tax=candidate division WOR-3 bacterium TaxID=2052148 RepID=A0A7V0T744_UNCW3|nr:50S ribosomal protein L23 [candidate division WOR-3 bacterium]